MEQRPSPGPASVEREQMIVAGGRQLRTASFGKFEADCLTLVLMHGGLDCIATWKDFPKALHIATGLSVLAYDRWGYGGSERLEGRRSPDYRRQELQKLANVRPLGTRGAHGESKVSKT